MQSHEQLREDEEQVALGGVMYRRAGCLLMPFLPVKAAGVLLITTKRIVFDPILYYKLVTRKAEFNLDDVADVEASGSNVELNVWDFVNIGKALTLKLKNGRKVVFRSTDADILAEAIKFAVRRFRGQA